MRRVKLHPRVQVHQLRGDKYGHEDIEDYSINVRVKTLDAIDDSLAGPASDVLDCIGFY